jgi:hypothetical protein
MKATKRNPATKAKKNVMSVSNVSEMHGDAGKDCSVDPLQALLSAPSPVKPPAPMSTPFSLSVLDAQIGKLVDKVSNSTARYGTFNADGSEIYNQITVCFHMISGHCSGAKGLIIGFQGYGGFDAEACKPPEGSALTDLDRWRPAVEADLYDNLRYPFVNEDHGHYNKESLEWLKGLLDPEGPFKSLLPLMAENTPEEVQKRRAFIFPDVSSLPARLTWCFAIASRLGFANARSLWRYLHLLDKGVDRRTSMLIATGFANEIKAGQVTGRIIKNYTGGFLGVDVTAYAGRFLGSNPVCDKPFGQSSVGTYGSGKVFQSGKVDMKNLTFADWETVITYTQARAIEQSAEIAQAA